MSYNKLLERQLHKHFGNEIIPDKFLSLFKTISASYDHNEQDRMLLERSIEISSEELIELNQSEKKAHEELKILFENIDEVFFSVSFPDFRLLLMSSACEKVYGYPLKDFQVNSKLWYELVLEEDKKIIDDNNAKMFAGESFTHEYRIHHKDGKIRWVETKITPTLDNDHKLNRIDGVTIDITKRKKAEEKLNASELRFRSLIENNTEMISMIDETGKFIYISPSVIKKFEFSIKEGLAMNSMEIIHPDDLGKAQTFIIKVLQNPSTPVLIPAIRNKKKDGTYIWVEGTITNLLNDKNVKAIVANFRDITDRKYAEEMLIESNENLKITIDRLKEAQQIGHLGSWILDIKSFTEVHTQEFYKIFESSKSEFATTVEDYLKYFHPDDRDKVKNTFDQALKSHEAYHYEARLLMKNGNIKNIMVNGKSILNENGELIKMHGTIQDITEQKKVELELEKNLAKLKKTNSELDKFVYSVSHDLRAPLSSILGIIEISQDHSEDELMQEHLRMIENNIKKLDGFIADILDYSRNSRELVKIEQIDFNDLINETTLNLKYMGGNNRLIDFKIDINESVKAYSDKSCLKIIFNNLVSNAIRYQNLDSKDPYVNIKIDTRENGIDIIVSDNGIGINKTFHNQVFDMFYRVSEGSVGSGLGLYIVKEAVNKLNGTIKMESELAKGSKFIINLPNQ